jgi:hypothetical protein
MRRILARAPRWFSSTTFVPEVIQAGSLAQVADLEGTKLSKMLSSEALDTVVLASPTRAFTSENIAASIMLMGTKKEAPQSKQALERLISLSKNKDFRPKHMSQIFAGFSGNRLMDKIPQAVLSHPTLRDLRDFGPRDVSCIARALGRLEQPVPWLLDAIAEEVCERPLTEFTMEEFSMLVYSYGKLQKHHVGPNTMVRVCFKNTLQ